jgi:hypothetical protein
MMINIRIQATNFNTLHTVKLRKSLDACQMGNTKYTDKQQNKLWHRDINNTG